MITNLKFYLLAGFFVVALAFGGFTILSQHKQIQAQARAFKVFEKQSEDQRRKLFLEIEELKIEDRKQEAVIDAAQDDRTRYETELNDLKKKYEKINFPGFSNDSLAGYFAKRRRQR